MSKICLRCGKEALTDGTDEWDWECGHCGFLWMDGSAGWGWDGLVYWSDVGMLRYAVPEGCLAVFGDCV